MSERWFSVDEIAAHLAVSLDTIYTWIIRKSMIAHKFGRLWRFLASEVDQRVKDRLAAQGSIAVAAQKAPKRRVARSVASWWLRRLKPISRPFKHHGSH